MPTLSSVEEEQLLMKLTVYLSFYVEARDNKSVEGMSKFMYKILDMITEAYGDGFKAASKGAFSTQQALKKDYKALINQQIKSVLDELEGELKDYKPHRIGMHSDDWGGSSDNPCLCELASTIQKIRSRYE